MAPYMAPWPLHRHAPLLTPAERRALRTLQTRYPRDHALFSNRELADLRFLRWLVHSNRLTP